MKAARRTRTDWTLVGQEIDIGNITVVVKKMGLSNPYEREIPPPSQAPLSANEAD